MKTHLIAALSLLTGAFYSAFAQTAPSNPTWAGQITYEAVRKVDPSSMRIMINGEQVKPGDPNFPTDIPDTRTFGQKVQVTGQYAKEIRDGQNAVIRRIEDGGAPQTTNIERPFQEQTFVDLSGQKTITLLTVGKDKDAKTYRADAPIKRVDGWQQTDQTKKIAGYTCRKATVPYNKETYSVWITTELPLTYSPIHELTPATGAVLLIEGSREQFRATKVNTSASDTTVALPNLRTQQVTATELADLRQKAIADFQQQLQLNERN